MRVKTRLYCLEHRLRMSGSVERGPTMQQVLDAIHTDPVFPSLEWLELHRQLRLRKDCEPPRETESIQSAIALMEPEFAACMARLQARIDAQRFEGSGSEGCVRSRDV